MAVYLGGMSVSLLRLVGPLCFVLWCSACAVSSGAAAPGGDVLRPDSVLVLQGDSITDGGRDRGLDGKANDGAALGNGYAAMIGAALLTDPELANLQVHNRGISGNKVFQLAERWDADALALEPDVVSILIGVNDIWHTRNGHYDGTVERYEADYAALLERTRRALPDVTLVVCEPFVLRCGAVTDDWFPEFDDYRAAALRVAGKHGALFVPFQSAFDAALALHPAEHWAADGVHPTKAGAALMAATWLRVVRGRD